MKNKIDWVKIGYKQIPKATFAKYGVKPFEIMARKMRRADGTAWNNISWADAKAEAKKLDYRLPTIQEMLVLLDAYKQKYPDNADIRHEEFLGIKELSYDEEVYLEWVDAPVPCLRGGVWGDGAYAGAFTLRLYWYAGHTGNNVGFRCAR